MITGELVRVSRYIIKCKSHISCSGQTHALSNLCWLVVTHLLQEPLSNRSFIFKFLFRDLYLSCFGFKQKTNQSPDYHKTKPEVSSMLVCSWLFSDFHQVQACFSQRLFCCVNVTAPTCSVYRYIQRS